MDNNFKIPEKVDYCAQCGDLCLSDEYYYHGIPACSEEHMKAIEREEKGIEQLEDERQNATD